MNPKMKPEEALFLFNNMEFAEKYQGKDEFAEVTIVIKLALEKQIPKKPDFEGDGYDENGFIILDTWICPCCEEKYETDYDNYMHCPNCGQAIDWSEEE